MRVLMLGDTVGRPGRTALRNQLSSLRLHKELDLIIANGENSAGGAGITTKVMKELFELGVDVITSGNHVWKNKEIYSQLDTEPRLLRPANYPPGAPGHGVGIYSFNGTQVAVLNLLGRHNLEDVDCPFRKADEILSTLPPELKHILVDFHAETSSEKKAMGWYLDGRVSAVAGTHTHVQTNDAQILPKGTGYISDLGMCGVEASILGLDHQTILDRFISKRPVRFKLAEGPISINGAIFTLDDNSGKCLEWEILRSPA